MRIITAIVWMLFAGSFAGCGNSTNNPEQAPVAQRQKTLIDEQLKAPDKAKAVQDALDQQKAVTDKAIQDSGG